MLGLLQAYRSSLKAIDVEEPIDLVVHRPLAFLIAKLAEKTPVTPNQLTVLSMSLGMAAGAALLGWAEPAAPIAGALLFLSQVVDCSDGMLARMRKTASEIGRMLDGIADLITLATALAGATWLLVRANAAPSWMPWLVVAAVALTIHTSSLHTGAYDHYKNFHLALTRGSREEDLQQATRRWEKATASPLPFVHRVIFSVYLGYLRKQVRFLSWFDPATTARYSELPQLDPVRAAAYRKHNGHLLDVWRSLFGVGSLVFGFAVFTAIGHLEIFLVFRLVFLNALFFGWLMPAQRRASRAIAAELRVGPSPSLTELRPSAA